MKKLQQEHLSYQHLALIYLYVCTFLPCIGMLQGHDPLIIENNKKERQTQSESCFTLLPFHNSLYKHKEDAAFKAQSCTNKEEEENKSGVQKG